MQLGQKKRILLHSCCGPCSTAVITRLLADYDITVFYFNPNITNSKEYEHRKAEQIRFLCEFCEKSSVNIGFIEGQYNPDMYYIAIKGLEQEPEGKGRCSVCFKLRLQETIKTAQKLGFDCFDTTLSVSPHKNFSVISQIADELATKYGVEYIKGNYKKQDGYKQSVELAKTYNLYRQDYCGCEFSEAH